MQKNRSKNKQAVPPLSDRRCHKIAPELYRMDQVIEMTGEEEGYDATGDYWILGLIQIVSGQVWFLRDGEKIPTPAQVFAMALPRNSIVSVVLKEAKTLNSAIFSKSPQPRSLGIEPMIFSVPLNSKLNSLDDVEKILQSCQDPVLIQRCSSPHPRSLALAKHLGQLYQEGTPLSELATKFKMDPSVLSRTFKKDWGKPPLQFRNYLRILASFRSLAEQSAVTDTAFEVGFNDLSRFMKQFKSTTGYTPKAIQKRSKNAK